MTLLLAAESVGSPVLAQPSIPANSQAQPYNGCLNSVDSGSNRPQLQQISRLVSDGTVPSVEEVTKAIHTTQCNWDAIKRSAKHKAFILTGRINLIKVLSTSATVLGAGGTAASAAGNNSGLAIGSGAVAMIGIFAGVFGNEGTIKRRDMCNQLVTLDPAIQTTFSIWNLQLSNESFRRGFTSELQSYISTIDAGVKGCIADSYSS